MRVGKLFTPNCVISRFFDERSAKESASHGISAKYARYSASVLSADIKTTSKGSPYTFVLMFVLVFVVLLLVA